MLTEKLQNISASLGDILGDVSVETADVIRSIRRELDAAADQAEHLENYLVPPAPMNAPAAAQGVM